MPKAYDVLLKPTVTSYDIFITTIPYRPEVGGSARFVLACKVPKYILKKIIYPESTSTEFTADLAYLLKTCLERFDGPIVMCSEAEFIHNKILYPNAIHFALGAESLYDYATKYITVKSQFSINVDSFEALIKKFIDGSARFGMQAQVDGTLKTSLLTLSSHINMGADADEVKTSFEKFRSPIDVNATLRDLFYRIDQSGSASIITNAAVRGTKIHIFTGADISWEPYFEVYEVFNEKLVSYSDSFTMDSYILNTIYEDTDPLEVSFLLGASAAFSIWHHMTLGDYTGVSLGSLAGKTVYEMTNYTDTD